MEKTYDLEEISTDFFYVLANEKRAIAFAHGLNLAPRTRAEIFSDVQKEYPGLPKHFFPTSQSLGSLLETLKGGTADMVEVAEMEKRYKGRLVGVKHYSQSEFGSDARHYILFGIETANQLGISLSGVFGDPERGGLRRTVETRLRILENLVEKEHVVEELKEVLGLRVNATLRHCRYLESSGLVSIRGAKLRGDSDISSYFVVGKPNGHMLVEGAKDLLSAGQVRKCIDNIAVFDVGDYVCRSALFNYATAPKSKKCHQHLIKILVENNLLEVHTNNSAQVSLTDKGHKVIDNLVLPIQEALSGDGYYQAKILEQSQVHRGHSKTSVYTMARKLGKIQANSI